MERKKSIHVWLYTILIVGIIAAVIWGATATKNAKALEVKHILEKIIDKDHDSLRFYYLGNRYENKVEHIGVKPSFKLDDVLIL